MMRFKSVFQTFLLCLLLPLTLSATTYYVSTTDGNDNYNGLYSTYQSGLDGPWLTVAKVNGSSFSAGDSVLFNKGGIWREQLTVPSSGSSGSPIAFGAYGTGDLPIICGSNQVSNWTEYEGAGGTETKGGWSGGDYNGTGDFNFRVLFAADTFSNDGVSVRIQIEAKSDATTTVVGAYIGQQASSGDAYDMQDGTITQITFDAGQAGASISAGQLKYSDVITYSFDKTKAYIVSIGVSDTYRAWTGQTGMQSYYRTAKSGNAGVADVSSYTTATAGVVYGLERLEINYESGIDNVWKATLTSPPDPVLFDESGTITWGDKKTEIGGLVDKYDWFYDSDADLLYVYSASDPDDAYTSIEACIRNQGIYSDYQGADYITVDSLEIKNTQRQGIFVQNVQPWIIQNCKIHHNGPVNGAYADSILIDTTSGCSILNNTIYEAGSHGVFVLDSDDVTVDGNTINDCHHSFIDVHGIDAGCDGVIVRNNYCYYTSASGIIAHGIYAEGASGKTITDLLIAYNIVSDNSSAGANNGIQLDAYVASAEIYNNTVYNSANFCFYVNCGTGTATIKNNIAKNIGGNDHRILRIVDKTNKTLTNNCWNHQSGIAFVIGSNSYTSLTAYQAGESLDSDSISSDPLFVNGSGTYSLDTDFQIQNLSPAIGAGVNVGLAQDYWGNAIEDPPSIGVHEASGDDDKVLAKTSLKSTIKHIRKAKKT